MRAITEIDDAYLFLISMSHRTLSQFQRFKELSMSNHLAIHYYAGSDLIYIRASRACHGWSRASIICEVRCPARDKARVFNLARARIEQLALQHSSCRVAECYETAWWSPRPSHSVAAYRAQSAYIDSRNPPAACDRGEQNHLHMGIHPIASADFTAGNLD